MTTPIVFEDGGVDPLADVVEAHRWNELPVFIATDRAPGLRQDDPPNWGHFYSNDRGYELLLARARVRIGDPDTSWPDLVAASRAAPRSWEPPTALTHIEEFGSAGVLGEVGVRPLMRSRQALFELLDDVEESADPGPAIRTFVGEINEQLARSARKDVYVFVHGFNTTVRGNTMLAGALWHYLGRDGAMVSFEWPSRASMFDYSIDKASARVSVLRLRLLFRIIHELTDAERIHVLAHSAGSPIVITALAQFRLIYDRDEILAESKIGHVVLAAPDMDLMLFENAITTVSIRSRSARRSTSPPTTPR